MLKREREWKARLAVRSVIDIKYEFIFMIDCTTVGAFNCSLVAYKVGPLAFS